MNAISRIIQDEINSSFKLQVKVNAARNLRQPSGIGTTDSYVVIQLSNGIQHKTNVAKNNCNPTYSVIYPFNIPHLLILFRIMYLLP
jgi:Ca2+-dependent lipid-binding protein